MNGSDDVLLECNDNVASDACLVSDDRLLDDEEQAASDSLEDLDKPEPDPGSIKRRPCLNRTGVVVVGAAVVGVFVVVGVIVVVILSVLSLHSTSKAGHHGAVNAAAKVANVAPSATVHPSKSVVVTLALHDNCTTRIVGSVKDGVHSFKVACWLHIVCVFMITSFNQTHESFKISFTCSISLVDFKVKFLLLQLKYR